MSGAVIVIRTTNIIIGIGLRALRTTRSNAPFLIVPQGALPAPVATLPLLPAHLWVSHAGPGAPRGPGPGWVCLEFLGAWHSGWCPLASRIICPSERNAEEGREGRCIINQHAAGPDNSLLTGTQPLSPSGLTLPASSPALSLYSGTGLGQEPALSLTLGLEGHLSFPFLCCHCSRWRRCDTVENKDSQSCACV